MSGKITISAQLQNAPENDLIGNVNTGLIEQIINQTGDDYSDQTQVLSDTEEALLKSDGIGTVGLVFIRNLDSAIDVYIGFADVSTADDARPIKVEPKEFCLFRANGNALNARAASGTPKIRVIMLED